VGGSLEGFEAGLGEALGVEVVGEFEFAGGGLEPGHVLAEADDAGALVVVDARHGFEEADGVLEAGVEAETVASERSMNWPLRKTSGMGGG
jgi:hypothetical protein